MAASSSVSLPRSWWPGVAEGRKSIMKEMIQIE
jgi:hypothetical protein